MNYLTPQGIRDRYRVLNGAIYSSSNHGQFLGAFKAGNRSRDVPGLYLAGGAAYPGSGKDLRNPGHFFAGSRGDSLRVISAQLDLLPKHEGALINSWLQPGVGVNRVHPLYCLAGSCWR